MVRALRDHALMRGCDLPYHLLKEVVSRVAGFSGTSEMTKARARGDVGEVVLDTELVVASVTAWSVPMSIAEAEECIAAGRST